MNTFRLVEVVLDRWWRQESTRQRFEQSVPDSAYLAFVADFRRKRLDEKLITRVNDLNVSPSSILNRLAKLMSASSPSPNAVLGAVVRFRNDHAHGPSLGKPLPLPWEHPNYDACIAQLVRLIGAMLDDEGVEPQLADVVRC